MGGLKDNNHSVSSKNEKYYISNDTWSDAKPMLTPRFGGSSVTIGNDIYTIGGISFNSGDQSIEVSKKVEVYHSNTNTWEELSDMPVIDERTLDERSYGTAYATAQRVAIGIKDYIYILSGINEINTSRGSPRIEKYNDRILRYSVSDDIWEYSRILYTSDLLLFLAASTISKSLSVTPNIADNTTTI